MAIVSNDGSVDSGASGTTWKPELGGGEGQLGCGLKGGSVCQPTELEEGSTPGQLRWYALRVRSNHEKTASLFLSSRGYEEFLPLYRTRRRWSDRTKVVELPLFAGYVFCRFDASHRLPILKTPGVVSVVSFGRKLVPVDDREIQSLRAVVSSGRSVQPWPYLRIGQRVRLVGGAMHDVEGILIELKKGLRVVLSISLLQRSVAVEVDRENVEPVF